MQSPGCALAISLDVLTSLLCFPLSLSSFLISHLLLFSLSPPSPLPPLPPPLSPPLSPPLQVFKEWNKGELDSFLIEITANIMAYKVRKEKECLTSFLPSQAFSILYSSICILQCGSGRAESLLVPSSYVHFVSTPMMNVKALCRQEQLHISFGEREKSIGFNSKLDPC